MRQMINESPSVRSILQLVARLGPSLHYAGIAVLKGTPAATITAPQLLISLWLYAYSQGILIGT
jgi:hypothetical protein